MRRAQQGQGPAAALRVDEASSASTFRELDDAFLQTQTKIWLGEVLHLRFDEDILVADLLADGELLFQVSKVIWKWLLKKNREQLKQSKVFIYERLSFGKSNGKYMPYSKVDSFLKICQILGLAGIDLFTPSDVVEKRNVRKVCICIRSVSKRSHMMRLNVPDFDIVTYTISMPNYIVGGIRRSLEQPQYSSSGSSGYSPRANSKALQQKRIFGRQNDQHGDMHYDSDEAESRLSVLEHEDSVDEDNFADMLSQLSDVTKEGSGGYGESGHDMHEKKSLAESVGSLSFSIMDSESVDSTPLGHNKESCCSTHSATDQCSRTRTSKCSLSSEESDSINSHLAVDSVNNDLELDSPPVADSERIYDGHVLSLDHSIQGDGERFAGSPKKGSVDLQKDTGSIDRHCDALACDRESVCSSCEVPIYGLNGELSDLSSGLTPRHTAGGKLPIVSEDSTNNIEQSMDKAIPVTGMTNGSLSRELNPEFSTEDDAGDKLVKSDDIAKNSIAPKKAEGDAPKSGKGLLKSVTGGITLIAAVFLIFHLRRSKERSFTTVIPSFSEKPIQSNSRAENIEKGKAAAVYPGEWLKV
ncbi:protein OPAQUE10-like [Phragmites australis]|uniref:protein OPAQUE10-like n=1 Tax=Phragmites australis TaxID=29695 RepID=UPI002D7653CD|nr:protein OPAQUE10-like [Phragmites australis]